jgi:Uma2 family endonuclease
MTAEEFIRLHGDESGVELVNGRVVRLPMPGGVHGEVSSNAHALIREAVKRAGLGRTYVNDTFIRTKPDGVRGADVCFVSYARLPKDRPRGKGPLGVPPDLVVEVRSPSDRIKDVSAKAYEYLEAGVGAVLVLDPDTESAAVFRPDELPQRFSNGDEVSLADVIPGLAVPARAFFE